MAKLFGLDESTIRRHARLSRDIDAIAAELGEEFKRAILTGQSRLSRKDITTLVGMSRSEKERHLRNLAATREGDWAARRKTAATRSATAGQTEQAGHAGKAGNRGPSMAEMPACREAASIPPASPPITAEVLIARTASEYAQDATAVNYRHEDLGDTTPGQDLSSPDEDDVDEAVLGDLTELFRQASHATRLAFLGQPFVRAALRRLDPALSA